MMILKGPKYFSESFGVGRVERINLAETKMSDPIGNSGGGILSLSAVTLYRF